MLGPTMMDPAIQATFEACLDAVRRGDAAGFAARFTPEAEGFCSLAGAVAGAGAFGGALEAARQRLPDLEVAPVRTYGEGPELAARLRLGAGGRDGEGVWAFRFDPAGRIERLVCLWDPAELLPAEPATLPPAAAEAVAGYFRTYNAGDEDAHMALLSPELVYFGAVSRMTAEGLETARGIFRSARTRMGLKRFEALRIFGTGPHLAVRVAIHGEGPAGPTEEGIWAFRLDARGRFDRVSILWNPGTFLTWPGGRASA